MTGFSRRKVLTAGAIGATGFVATITAQAAEANTQSPPAPENTVDPNGRFANKVVLITGATSGIGESTARAFASEGATVHFCGRREALGEQVAKSIRSAGGKATYQRADVRSEADIKAFVDSCVSRMVELTLHLIMLVSKVLRLRSLIVLSKTG